MKSPVTWRLAETSRSRQVGWAGCWIGSAPSASSIASRMRCCGSSAWPRRATAVGPPPLHCERRVPRWAATHLRWVARPGARQPLAHWLSLWAWHPLDDAQHRLNGRGVGRALLSVRSEHLQGQAICLGFNSTLSSHPAFHVAPVLMRRLAVCQHSAHVYNAEVPLAVAPLAADQTAPIVEGEQRRAVLGQLRFLISPGAQCLRRRRGRLIPS